MARDVDMSRFLPPVPAGHMYCRLVTGTPQPDPAAFAEARLAEDEAAAKAAQARHPVPWAWKAAGARNYLQVLRDANGGYIAEFAGGADVRPDAVIHVARHAPARILREVQAKRAILAEHANAQQSAGPLAPAKCQRCFTEGAPGFYAPDYLDWPCPTVCALIAVWADHPDYDQAWKP